MRKSKVERLMDLYESLEACRGKYDALQQSYNELFSKHLMNLAEIEPLKANNEKQNDEIARLKSEIENLTAVPASFNKDTSEPQPDLSLMELTSEQVCRVLDMEMPKGSCILCELKDPPPVVDGNWYLHKSSKQYRCPILPRKNTDPSKIDFTYWWSDDESVKNTINYHFARPLDERYRMISDLNGGWWFEDRMDGSYVWSEGVEPPPTESEYLYNLKTHPPTSAKERIREA